MNIVYFLEQQGKTFWYALSIFLVIFIGILDAITGFELAFSLFYLIPVSAATWFCGRKIGVLAAIVCAVSWFAADMIVEHPYSHPVIPYWNTIIRFGIFLLVALLISALRKAHEQEKTFARNDYLTGAVNRRYFSELLQMEINREQRSHRPFSIAYIDLDNFKYVNDTFGHSEGDKVLCATVLHANNNLRKVDVVGRLGGDEFALLLVETDQEDACIVMSKLQTSLLGEMTINNWPVTFSIGVVTCRNVPTTTEDLIRAADKLMYSVKNAGKNSVAYALFQG